MSEQSQQPQGLFILNDELKELDQLLEDVPHKYARQIVGFFTKVRYTRQQEYNQYIKEQEKNKKESESSTEKIPLSAVKNEPIVDEQVN